MAYSGLCCSSRDKEGNVKDPKKEICRLKLNWLFMTIIAGLYAISYTSISSSFHQFITNPREEDINRTLQDTKHLEPGLGESEVFYSWVITVFNIGAVIGSLTAGLSLKWLPYWHMILTSLALHTLGYIIYAVATTGWLVMLSKLLSGVFIGAEMTLALAYFGESNSSYRTALKQLGKDDGERKASRVKHTLFALHSVGVNIGYIFGPGVAVIFAQFSINQFRSIAWYNVAVGLVVIVTQLLIFRGESSCDKLTKCLSVRKQKKTKNKTKSINSERSTSDKIISTYILIFLIVSRAALGFRFCVYETLFNPILSDSFGLNERDSSYFFFGLVAAQVCGTILILFLQQIRLTNRLIAVMGLIMTIIATTLMSDWQAAIHHDPCTEASLFHHPELLHTYTSEMNDQLLDNNNNNKTSSIIDDDAVNMSSLSYPVQCESVNISTDFQHHLKDVAMDMYVYPNIVTDDVMSYDDDGCEMVESCPHCSMVGIDYLATPTCLHLHINTQRQCLETSPLLPWQQKTHTTTLSKMYMCNSMKSHFTYCVYIYPLTAHSQQFNEQANSTTMISVQTDEAEEVYIADIHRQSVHIIEGHISQIAYESCIHHDGHCHWNPDSSVTHHHCEDCPPICREKKNYLNFVQFTLASALLLISIPVARIPITSILSDIVSQEQQGTVMGVAQALNAVARSVGPLWLDAAYEGMQKRTFLAMSLSLVCYSIILIGMILIYSKLAPAESSKSSTSSTSDDSDSDYITLKQIDSMSDSDFMP